MKTSQPRTRLLIVLLSLAVPALLTAAADSPDTRPWTAKVEGNLLARASAGQQMLARVTYRRPDELRIRATKQPAAPEVLDFIADTGRSLEADFSPRGVRFRRYEHLPVATVLVPPGALEPLASDPRVLAVSPVIRATATRTEAKALIQATELISQGLTGAGVGVAVFDSGIDYTHSELSPGGLTPSAKTVPLYDFFHAAGSADYAKDDACGHGTEVAGIIAGSDNGVAPSARLISVKVLGSDCSTAENEDSFTPGVEAVIDSVAAGNPYNIKVINMSLGGYADDIWPPNPGNCDSVDTATKVMFETLRDAGVLIVVSAGNGGCVNGIAWPACLSTPLTVGAVYDANIGQASYGSAADPLQCTTSCSDATTAADKVACYSDSGDRLDVWAPGTRISTTRAGGGIDPFFSGTSAAAPFVSGAAALLTQAVPGRTAPGLFAALKNYGDLVTDPRNGITRNRIRADLALAALQGQAQLTYYVSNVTGQFPGRAPAVWYSDLSVLNTGTSAATITLSFHGTASPTPISRTLQPEEQVTWINVPNSAFGLNTPQKGMITIESNVQVDIFARTYSRYTNSEGQVVTQGQSYPALQIGETLPIQQAAYLGGLRSDGDYYTNVDFLNVGTVAGDVKFDFYSNAGALLRSITMRAEPLARVDATDALPDGHTGAFAKVTVLTSGVRAIVFASVIDGISRDPTTVEMTVR